MLNTSVKESGFNADEPWNKGKLNGQKPPLRLKEIWAIRIRLQLANEIKELALLNLAIDSKLCGCDLVKLKVRDITHGTKVMSRRMVLQQKIKRPVHQQTRESLTV